jgi:hypothetical protein
MDMGFGFKGTRINGIPSLIGATRTCCILEWTYAICSNCIHHVWGALASRRWRKASLAEKIFADRLKKTMCLLVNRFARTWARGRFWGGESISNAVAGRWYFFQFFRWMTIYHPINDAYHKVQAHIIWHMNLLWIDLDKSEFRRSFCSQGNHDVSKLYSCAKLTAVMKRISGPFYDEKWVFLVLHERWGSRNCNGDGKSLTGDINGHECIVIVPSTA